MWHKIKDDRIRFCIDLVNKNLDYTNILTSFFNGMSMEVVNAINARCQKKIYIYGIEWKISFVADKLDGAPILNISKRNGKIVEQLEIQFSKLCFENICDEEILEKIISFKKYEKTLFKQFVLTEKYSILFNCLHGDVGLQISSKTKDASGGFYKKIFNFTEVYRTCFTKTKEEYLAEDAKYTKKEDVQR